MTMERLWRLYGNEPRRPVDQVIAKWAEKDLDEFLGTEVFSGVLVADMLTGDGLLDQIPDKLLEGFKQLMGQKANTYDEVRSILLDKVQLGDESVLGLINKIKGQIAENHFVEACSRAGIHAHLADLGNQEGWDVVVDHGDGALQYVQVKLYDDPHGVMAHIREVYEKLGANAIHGAHGEIVHAIDFAVPAGIADEVKAQVAAAHLDVHVLPMSMSAEQGAAIVQEGIDNVSSHMLENFFQELLGAAATAITIQMLANAFYAYWKSKDASWFWDAMARGSVASLAAMTVATSLSALANKVSWLGGPPVTVLVLATSISTRGVVMRLLGRDAVVERLAVRTAHLDGLVATLSTAV